MKTRNELLPLALVLALASSMLGRPDPQKEKIPANTPPEIRTELEKLLSSELPLRLEGAYKIGNLGEKAGPAIPLLIGVLQGNEGMVDVDEASLKFFEKDTTFMVFGGKAATINPVQIVASVALAKIGEAARGPLRAELSKADPTNLPFAYFADSLVRMQDPETTRMLIAMLSDPDRHKRYRIAEALRFSKDPASIDALITALKDQESSVKSAAANSLKRITGQDFGEDAGKWEAWRTKNPAAKP